LNRQTHPELHKPRLRLRITAVAEKILRGGHPWVFADSVRDQNRAGETGELAAIYDRKDKFLAIGLYDAESPIRVRVLHSGRPQVIDPDWWSARLQQALDRRQGLLDKDTTGCRLINGESDGWPGLVLDQYDKTLVLKIYTAAWLSRLEEIADLIQKRLAPDGIVLRLSRNIQEPAAKEFNRADGTMLLGPAPKEPVVFMETGLRFEADVLRGQKTGFFLDQRENRRKVESLADGRRVLNAFSFSGGFSLYAARGGAKSVTDLDISAHALASARLNLAVNGSDRRVAHCPHEYIQADALEWLAENGNRQFDLIVLDPPSFARREAERAVALRAYERLTSLGIQHLSGGGILVACSCSAHVTAEEFFDAVTRSAVKLDRKFVKLDTTGHAPDHPATFKEAEYLKAIYLRFN
jgi:23S rRNA (cytosine1962-C5)-methyltransferase